MLSMCGGKSRQELSYLQKQEALERGILAFSNVIRTRSIWITHGDRMDRSRKCRMPDTMLIAKRPRLKSQLTRRGRLLDRMPLGLNKSALCQLCVEKRLVCPSARLKPSHFTAYNGPHFFCNGHDSQPCLTIANTKKRAPESGSS